MLLKVDWEYIGSNTQAEVFKKCREILVKCSISLETGVDKKHTLAQSLIHVSLPVTDGAEETKYEGVSIRNPNAVDENNQEFQQLEDKRPEQLTEEQEESAVNVLPEHEEANLEEAAAEGGSYSEGRSLLQDTSFESNDSGEATREDITAGNLLELDYFVLLLGRSLVKWPLDKY